MKTLMLATAAVLALGIGSAFAESEGGPNTDTVFTQHPSLLGQAPAQTPTAVARGQQGSPTAAFMTSHRGAGSRASESVNN